MTEDFLDFISEQSYWISRAKVEEEFPRIMDNMELIGITVKENPEDSEDILIPRRDLRQGFRRMKNV